MGIREGDDQDAARRWSWVNGIRLDFEVHLPIALDEDGFPSRAS